MRFSKASINPLLALIVTALAGEALCKGFEDIDDAVRRSDGLYNVICLDGSFELGVTSQALSSGAVCEPTAQPEPEPEAPEPGPPYASFLSYCLSPNPHPAVAATLSGLQQSLSSQDCHTLHETLSTTTDLRLEGLGLRSLAPLAGYTQIEMLRIGFNSIKDLRPLSGFSQLSSINFRFNQVDDIAPLSNLPNLSSMYADNNPLGSVHSLENVPSLTYIDVTHTQLSQLDFNWRQVDNLRLIRANYNQITSLPIELATSRVRILRLQGNQISDLSPLSTANQLNFLDISRNNVNTLIPLGQRHSLSTLRFFGNPLGTSVAAQPNNCPQFQSAAQVVRNLCVNMAQSVLQPRRF